MWSFHTITPAAVWTVETRQDGFMLVYGKSWTYHLNAAQMVRHFKRQFSNLPLSSFGEPMRIVAYFLSFNFPRGQKLVLILICSEDLLRVQRWFSEHLGCNKLLFKLLLPSYHLQPVSPFSFNLNKVFQPRELTLTRYFCFWDHFL